MVDARLLLRGLQEYHKSVLHHLKLMHEEHLQLSDQYNRLRDVYHGEAADEFKPYWQKTMLMFRQYEDNARAIASILEKRIEELKMYDRKTGGLG